MLRKLSHEQLDAFIHLQQDHNFNIILSLLKSEQERLYRASSTEENEVRTRWLQGALQLLDTLLFYATEGLHIKQKRAS